MFLATFLRELIGRLVSTKADRLNRLNFFQWLCTRRCTCFFFCASDFFGETAMSKRRRNGRQMNAERKPSNLGGLGICREAKDRETGVGS